MTSDNADKQAVTITHHIVDSPGRRFTFSSGINSEEDAYKFLLEQLPCILLPMYVALEVFSEGTEKVYNFKLEPQEYATQFLRKKEKDALRDMKDRLKPLWEVLEKVE